MRIGFIARGVEDDFRFCKEHGIRCVEFNLHEDMTLLGHADQINAWRAAYGVDISHVGLFGRDFLAWDEVEVDRHVSDLKRCVEFASEIGAPIITTGGGDKGDRTMKDACEELLRALGPTIDLVHAKKMRLAFYNCHWTNFVVGPPAWDRLFDHRPDLGIKFDPSHPLHDHKDWRPQMRDYGQFVLHAHAKDTLLIDGRPFEDVPAGLGSIPWGEFFALLYHFGYDGDVNIEPHSHTWLGERFEAGILIAKRHLEQFVV